MSSTSKTVLEGQYHLGQPGPITHENFGTDKLNTEHKRLFGLKKLQRYQSPRANIKSVGPPAERLFPRKPQSVDDLRPWRIEGGLVLNFVAVSFLAKQLFPYIV